MNEKKTRANLVEKSNGAQVSGGERGGLGEGSKQPETRETTEGMISTEMSPFTDYSRLHKRRHSRTKESKERDREGSNVLLFGSDRQKKQACAPKITICGVRDY